MIELAKSEPGIPVRPQELDSHPWVLNVLNGTLDLRTGQLRPHAREDLLTKLAPVAYDPEAQCPLWETFLSRIFAGDGGLIRFVQKALGYLLTGSTQEQCFFILYGVGANSKSTLIQTISALLRDYAKHTPTETLLVQQGDRPHNDLAGSREHGLCRLPKSRGGVNSLRLSSSSLREGRRSQHGSLQGAL